MTQPLQLIRFEERLYEAPFLAVRREIGYYCNTDKFRQPQHSPDYELVVRYDDSREGRSDISINSRVRIIDARGSISQKPIPNTDFILGITVALITEARTVVRLWLYDAEYDNLLTDILSRVDFLFLQQIPSTPSADVHITEDLNEMNDEADSTCEASQESDDVDGADLEPWERISNYRWDRIVVEMLHDPSYATLTNEQIAVRVGLKWGSPLTESTVSSRISALRKQYGEEIVPKRKGGRKPGEYS